MDEVEQIKQKIDIVDLIGGYVGLKRAGRNFRGLCPFHGEKSPSFMVSSELQIFKCFGCGKGGDIFGFIQEIEGVEFVEALNILAERAGVRLERRNDGQRDIKAELMGVQELAADYFHYLLAKHKVGEEAREYLKGRKVGEKLIEQFRIGFSLNSWDGLTRYLGQRKKVKPEVMEKTGLVIRNERGGYDRFRGRLMFPLTDARGRVIGFAGRVLPGAREDEPKYINSPETEIYHKSETLFGFFQAKPFIKKMDRAVVVEGELDMISSFGAGVGETVAIKGSALTEEQIKMLSRITKNLVLALDADAAGVEATKRGIEMAERAGMNLKVVLIEGGKDPDEIARKSPGKWKEMLEKALDVYEFYIQTGLKANDVGTVAGKRKFGAEVLPVIAKIENQVVRSFYVRKVANLLEVDEGSVWGEMNRVAKQLDLKAKPAEVKEEKSGGSRQERLEEELVALVWARAQTGGDEGIKTALMWSAQMVKEKLDGAAGKILEKWGKSGGKLTVAEFIKNLESELQGLAQLAYLHEIESDLLERNWQEMVAEWEKLVAKQKLGVLVKEMKKAEVEGDGEKVAELERLVVDWTKRLQLANAERG